MKTRFKKYAIARSGDEKLTYWPREQFSLVSLVDASHISTGFHKGGYTCPDFITFDTIEEGVKFLYEGPIKLYEKIIEVSKVRFSLSILSGFKEYDMQENLTADEWFIEWLIYSHKCSCSNCNRDIDLGGFYRGRVKTIVEIEGLTFENIQTGNIK